MGHGQYVILKHTLPPSVSNKHSPILRSSLGPKKQRQQVLTVTHAGFVNGTHSRVPCHDVSGVVSHTVSAHLGYLRLSEFSSLSPHAADDD